MCFRMQESIFVHHFLLFNDASISVFIMYEIVSIFLLFDVN